MIRTTETGADKIDPAHVSTTVVLHCYSLKRNEKTKTFDYSEEDQSTVNPNDGKRHKIKSLKIAKDGNPYPSAAKLKAMLNNAVLQNHSNIKTSQQYGGNLGNFCPTCLASCKKECNKLFGWNL